MNAHPPDTVFYEKKNQKNPTHKNESMQVFSLPHFLKSKRYRHDF